MGAAKQKKIRKEQENAAILINRSRAPEAEPVRAFERNRYDCMPDTCVVRRDPDKELTAGQLIGGKKIRQQTGTVEISGIDWLKPGDKVLFSKFGGTDIQLDDAELVHVHKLQVYIREKVTA
jgi:co-chaperonin GroES (HSP10)